MHDAQVRAGIGEGVGVELPSIEAVYREHGDRLWRAVLLYCGDRDVASDAVAEAFAQALRRDRDIRSPLAWITTAAFRIAAGELQRRRRPLPTERTVPQEPGAGIDIVRALDRLPTKQRQAVVLRFYVGLSHPEIAHLTGSTVGAVAVNVHRGRTRLRELLGETDD